MRQGWIIVPAGLVLIAAMLGAGGGAESPPDGRIAVLDRRFGHPIAPIFLVLRPDVQRDLRLNQRQIVGARDLLARLVERLLTVKDKAGQAAMTEKRAIDEAMTAWLRRELSGIQFERLTQISLQWEGIAALRRPSVAGFLGLGEPQRHRIADLLADRDHRQAAGALGPAEFDRYSREALGLLNPIQRQQWDNLLGPPCRFSIGSPPAPPADPTAGPALKGQPRPPGR